MQSNNLSDYELIGSGVDGKVFKKNNFALKICNKIPSKNQIDLISLIIKDKPEHFVKVFFYNEENGSFHYTMEFLTKLSDDENKLFHTLISHEDCNKEKNISKLKVNQTINELKDWLDFDADMVTLFCEQIRTSKIKHLDMHPRNIMKSNSGKFKFIDLERIKIN